MAYTLGAGPGFSQRMRDIYTPYDTLGAEEILFVPSETIRDESFAPLAQVQFTDGTLLLGKVLLGLAVIGGVWWAVSRVRPETVVAE